jgi:hypothetical protein
MQFQISIAGRIVEPPLNRSIMPASLRLRPVCSSCRELSGVCATRNNTPDILVKTQTSFPFCSPKILKRLQPGPCFDDPIRSRQTVGQQAPREADAQPTFLTRSPNCANQKQVSMRSVSKADFSTQGKPTKCWLWR